MSDTRWKNRTYTLELDSFGNMPTVNAQIALLMDIRDELQEIKRTLQCKDALDIPAHLKKIVKNTTKKPRRRMK